MGFRTQLTNVGHMETSNRYYRFIARQSGVYWVTICIDEPLTGYGEACHNSSCEINATLIIRNVRNNNWNSRTHLTVYAERRIPGIVSAPVRLSWADSLAVQLHSGQWSSNESMFSMTWLTKNRKPYTGPHDHICFLGLHGRPPGDYEWGSYMVFHVFNLNVYGPPSATVTVPHQGLYLVSMRVQSARSNWESRAAGQVPRINMVLQVNDGTVYTAFTWKVLAMGQTTALRFSQGDRLKVKLRRNRHVEFDSFLAFAVVSP